MIEILFLIILKIFFSIFIFSNVILALRAMMFYISTIHAKRDQTARPTSEKRNQSKFFSKFYGKVGVISWFLFRLI